MVEKAKESGTYKSCRVFKAGVEFGIGSAGAMIETWTVGRIYSLIGLDSMIYTEDDYGEDFAAAFCEAYDGEPGKEYYKMLEIYNDGIEVGILLFVLGLLQAVTGTADAVIGNLGGLTTTEEIGVLIMDSNGQVSLGTVSAEGVKAGIAGLGSAEVIEELVNGKDEGDSETGKTKGEDVKFGSDVKSEQKLNKQMNRTKHKRYGRLTLYNKNQYQ